MLAAMGALLRCPPRPWANELRPLAITYQIGQALQASHEAGIVHRDLKPANIFLDKNGPFPNFVKVLDFGIAKVVDDAGGLKTNAKILMGTPAYMSPEQASGQANDLDARSDQFALAVILYEMLAGGNPFSKPDEPTLGTLTHIIFDEVPPLPLPRIGPALQRAMRKQPIDRFPSIKEFLSALGARRVFGHVVAPASIGTSAGEMTTQPPSAPAHHPRRFLRIGAVAVAAAGILLIGTRIADEVARKRSVPAVQLTPKSRPPAAPLSAAKPPAVQPAVQSAAQPPAAEVPTFNPPAAQPIEPPKSARPSAPELSPVVPVQTERPKVILRASAEPKSVPTQSVKATHPASPPSSYSGLLVQVLAPEANTLQRNLIRDCWTKEVKPLATLPRNYKILLQRSGVLHIMDAPEEVRQTDLSLCLRQAFHDQPVPEAVTISVRGIK